jgi:hypothetical protein
MMVVDFPSPAEARIMTKRTLLSTQQRMLVTWLATRSAFMNLSLEDFSLAARKMRLDSRLPLKLYTVVKTFLPKACIASDFVLHMA